MAKKRRGGSSNKRLATPGRGVSINARRPARLPLVRTPPKRRIVPPPQADRRLYHPNRPFQHIVNRTTPYYRLKAHSPSLKTNRRVKPARRRLVPSAVKFANPRGILICVRRSIRKEIMHALGKAGAGQKRQKRPVRSEYSSIHC